MEVNVLERLLLLSILPKEGSIVTLKLIRDLINDLGFSDEEMTRLELKTADDGRTVWNAEVARECDKDVKFGVNGCALVKKTLQDLSEQGRLPMDAVSLWEKFVDTDLRVIDGGKAERN